MASWITERDYRQANASGMGLGLNVAFIREIKEDNVEFRELLGQVEQKFRELPVESERENDVWELHQMLSRLRDELETYFALEEFYGGFRIGNSSASLGPVLDQGDLARQIENLKRQHIDLYLQLDRVVESSAQVVYGECQPNEVDSLIQPFSKFIDELKAHESYEMDVIMQQCNQDLGAGD